MPTAKRIVEFGPPNKVLLVEGSDDQHMIWNLLDSHGIHEGVVVEDGKGYENIRSGLGTRIKAGNQTNIGIIVDADIDFGKRWQAIRDVIVRADYADVPERPDRDGTIIGQAQKVRPAKSGLVQVK